MAFAKGVCHDCGNNDKIPRVKPARYADGLPRCADCLKVHIEKCVAWWRDANYPTTGPTRGGYGN